MIRNRILISAIVLLLSIVAFSYAGESGNMPRVNRPAPLFSLANQDGTVVNLSDYRGMWVVLYFYPGDFGSECTLEARNFQRDLESYQNVEAAVIGISVNDVKSHKSFSEKEGLKFELLADADHKVAELYGVLKQVDGEASSSIVPAWSRGCLIR
jgi:thioredoxin-dependent peroxiredoxin